jgi:hypothetical protein
MARMMSRKGECKFPRCGVDVQTHFRTAPTRNQSGAAHNPKLAQPFPDALLEWDSHFWLSSRHPCDFAPPLPNPRRVLSENHPPRGERRWRVGTTTQVPLHAPKGGVIWALEWNTTAFPGV